MRALPAQQTEDQVIRRLSQAMISGVQVDAAGNRVAPNVYLLTVAPSALAQWQDPIVLAKLRKILKEAGDQAGLRFTTLPIIEMVEAAGTAPGKSRVEALHREPSIGMTQDMTGNTPPQSSIGEAPEIPDNAFLIVGGVKEFALFSTVINIGRRLDNDLVIEDPRVSRQHAQLPRSTVATCFSTWSRRAVPLSTASAAHRAFFIRGT